MQRGLAIPLACLAAFAAACGTTTAAEHLTDTKTLVATARAQLESVTDYHVLINYTQDQIAFKDDLHIHLPSDAMGTVSENGNAVQVLEAGGMLYVQGSQFFAEYGQGSATHLFGDRWVLVSPGMLRTSVVDVYKLQQLLQSVLSYDLTGAKRVDDVPAATAMTAQIKTSWGAMYIEELPPHRLVKLETSQSFVSGAGYANLEFEIFGYGDPVAVQAPADYADPNNPLTMPPMYQLAADWRWGSCYYGESCGFTATVTNHGGTYTAPPSTYRFVLSNSAHTYLGECGGAIAVVANGKSTNIGCQVASAAYRSYTGGQVWGDLTLRNPAYDG